MLARTVKAGPAVDQSRIGQLGVGVGGGGGGGVFINLVNKS